jgi:hypothetical protein
LVPETGYALAKALCGWSDQALRQCNLWSWVDGRDVAQACRFALEAAITGAHIFTIAAADTLMQQSSRC